jgi:alcohol dehydrogenase class IV
MLPHVMRINLEDATVAGIYNGFSAFLSASGITKRPLIDWVAELIEQSSLPLLELSVAALPALAQDAANQWTGKFNPRALQVDDYVALYRRALRINAA